MSQPYARLSNYNEIGRGILKGSMSSPPVPASTVTGFYVVPDFTPKQSYNALMHDQKPDYAGYFDIEAAYGKNASNNAYYTKYMERPCGGSVFKPTPPSVMPIPQVDQPSPMPTPALPPTLQDMGGSVPMMATDNSGMGYLKYPVEGFRFEANRNGRRY